MEIVIFFAILLLAYVNGANDNFKGVSTLYGGGILNYKEALTWSSVSTALGCLSAFVFVQGLAKKFGGAGLVQADLLSNAILPLTVAIAALGTVGLATWLGFPVSTTHALLGSLAGVGFLLGFSDGFEGALWKLFLPLILSPLIAAFIACLGWKMLKTISKRTTLNEPTEELCLCVSPTLSFVGNSTLSVSTINPSLSLGSVSSCNQRGLSELVRLPKRDLLHLGSAFAVCAARGLNDAPKIAGLLLLTSQKEVNLVGYGAISIAMVLGGVFHSHRIAERMSVRVSPMDEKSSVWSNLVTSTLVIFASKHGVPVSTTHTAVGSIAGTGKSEAKLRWSELNKILCAWGLTLPCSFALTLLLVTLFKTMAVFS